LEMGMWVKSDEFTQAAGFLDGLEVARRGVG
jgi:hypothetical protein